MKFKACHSKTSCSVSTQRNQNRKYHEEYWQGKRTNKCSKDIPLRTNHTKGANKHKTKCA